jgi:KUP system potassium uptake protein
MVWFVTIAALGVRGIVRNPSVFRALDPVEALSYIGRHPSVAFVLCRVVESPHRPVRFRAFRR